MKKNKNGFTLIELMVVVTIVGILATLALPQYQKTVENAKATNAAAITHMIASANKMYHMDRLAYVSGTMQNGCTPNCAAGASTSVCQLTGCNYIVPRDWSVPPAINAPPYTYSAGNSCGGNMLACSVRNSGAHNGVWGYNFDTSGKCIPRSSDTPTCPVF